MRSTWTISPILLAAAMAMTGAMTGCNNKQDEVAVLMQENRELQQMMDERNRALEASDAERRQQALRLSDLERQLASAPTSGGGFGGEPTGFESIAGVSSERSPGMVRVRVEGDVLFDSGRATLKDSAKRTLNQVATVLNSNYGAMQISVEGHTDQDPIRRSGFKTNYHLGFERAWAVREYLISRGVSGDRIALKSFGPNDPQATKAASRRVEVVVLTGS